MRYRSMELTMRTAKTLASLCSMLLLVVGFQNCAAKQSFSSSSTGTATTSASSTPAASGQISQGAIALPSVQFQGPPCEKGTACSASFQLAAAISGTFSFSWQTNDSLYLQTPAAGQPMYGQPNVDYVPTSGQITFQAGQSLSQSITIQNINPTNNAMVIGVLMNNCTFEGQPEDCSKLFH